MSVLVKKLSSDDTKRVEVYVKGSPEKIHQLCKPESGTYTEAHSDCVHYHYTIMIMYPVPPDFFTVLSKYTKKGCRVLALAHRYIQVKPHRINKVSRYCPLMCSINVCICVHT